MKSDGVCTAQYKMLLFCVKTLERVLACLKKKEKHFLISRKVLCCWIILDEITLKLTNLCVAYFAFSRHLVKDQFGGSLWNR